MPMGLYQPAVDGKYIVILVGNDVLPFLAEGPVNTLPSVTETRHG